MNDFLKIEYGKYINNMPEQIDVEHIVFEDSGMISRSVEPGEPNVPTKETFTFVLANLTPAGEERYPITFWENAARTQAEGSTQPLQIYFHIYVDGGSQFLGMLRKVNYDKDRGKCTVEIGDILEILRTGKKQLLAGYEFETRCISKREAGASGGADFGGNDLDNAKSIDDQDINHASLVFELSRVNSNSEAIESDIAVHLGWDNLDFSDYREIVRSAWVQIEEITILTRVRFFQRNISLSDQNVIYIEVWHNDEDSISVGSGADATEVLPRGQFLDADGNKLVWQEDPKERVTMVLHEPDLGNGTPAAIHIDDTDLDEDFIFGVPFTEETGYIQINSAAYAYFDVVDLITGAIETEINDFHSDSGEDPLSFFDTSRVVDLHRKAFWADIKMTGLASHTLADAIVAVARQTSAWLYTDRFGNIVVHGRDYSDDVLDGSQPATLVENEDWEPIDGIKYDNGFSTFEAEVPVYIIEINNLRSRTNRTIYADPAGPVTQPALRNKKIKLSNFRVTDLGVPQQSNPLDLPVLRYSPDDASWPHSDILENFLPKPETQLQKVAESLAWPTPMSRIKLAIEFSNLGEPESPAALDYIKDEDDQVWMILEEQIEPTSLTTECEIQLIGTLSEGGSGGSS